MKFTDNNYTITTIYFDGQFWCALIEKCIDGKNFSGRYVFGAEPSNPRLTQWLLYEFAFVPLLPVEGRQKIRFKKLARQTEKNAIPKSLEAFSKAQKVFCEERKAENKKRRKTEEKQKYLRKKLSKKAKKGH